MWYKILKVDENASEEEIKVAYDKMMKNPSIANDMVKSFKVRDAYKQGLEYANTYTTDENMITPNQQQNNAHKTSVGNRKAFKKSKSSAKQSDSMSIYGKIQLIFVLTFVIAIIVVAVARSVQETLYDDVVYDSEISNCIAKTTEMDLEEFEELIYTNDYVLGYTYSSTKVFIKEKEGYKFFLEVENSDDSTSCSIKLVEEIDLEWQEKPAKLVGVYTVSGLYKYGNQLGNYDVKYSVFKADPFYETHTVLFESYNEVEDDIDEIDPTEYMNEEYNEYISNDSIFEYFDILKSELESFEE